MPQILILSSLVTRASLIASTLDGDLVKAVVDVARGVMAVGGGLHSDEEQVLLDDGSRQWDLWGINLFPKVSTTDWIEFDSMINLRPNQGNRSRGVDDPAVREKIRVVVDKLVQA